MTKKKKNQHNLNLYIQDWKMNWLSNTSKFFLRRPGLRNVGEISNISGWDKSFKKKKLLDFGGQGKGLYWYFHISCKTLQEMQLNAVESTS